MARARKGIFQDRFEADMKGVLASALAPYDRPIRVASANAQQTLIIEAGAGSAAEKRVATATSGAADRKRSIRRRGEVKRIIRDVAFTVIAMVAAFLIVNFLIVPHWGEIAEWFSHLFG